MSKDFFYLRAIKGLTCGEGMQIKPRSPCGHSTLIELFHSYKLSSIGIIKVFKWSKKNVYMYHNHKILVFPAEWQWLDPMAQNQPDNAKRSILTHPTFVNDLDHKNLLFIGKFCVTFDQNTFKGLLSSEFTLLIQHLSIMTLTFNPWP